MSLNPTIIERNDISHLLLQNLKPIKEFWLIKYKQNKEVPLIQDYRAISLEKIHNMFDPCSVIINWGTLGIFNFFYYFQYSFYFNPTNVILLWPAEAWWWAFRIPESDKAVTTVITSSHQNTDPLLSTIRAHNTWDKHSTLPHWYSNYIHLNTNQTYYHFLVSLLFQISTLIISCLKTVGPMCLSTAADGLQ